MGTGWPRPVVGVLLFVIVSLFVPRSGAVPPHLADEVYWSVVLCGVSMPVIMMTSSVVGVLYGAQRFDIVSTVQAPAAFLQYMLPLLMILWRQDLPAIVAGLLATRWIVGAVLFVAAVRTVSWVARRQRLSLGRVRAPGPIWRLGDGLQCGESVARLSRSLSARCSRLRVSAIAYYAVPADMVVRLVVIPSSLATVLYPVFSGLPFRTGRGRRLRCSRAP